MNNKNRTYFMLLIIIILGTWLRFSGLQWGLTNSQYFHGYSYHPDEACILNALRRMEPKKFNFYPDYAQAYGTGALPIYLTGIALKLAEIFRFVTITKDYNFYKSHPDEFSKLYLVGRVVSALFGIATIFVVYLLGKEFYNEITGLLSAFLLAIVPVHVVNSHYLARDVIVTFFVCLVFLMSFKILNRDNVFLYLAAGLFTGLATNGKYNHALVIFIPVLAHTARKWAEKERNIIRILFHKRVFILVFITIITFLVTNPYAILAFPDFKKHMINMIGYIRLLTPPQISSTDWQPDSYLNQWIFYSSIVYYFGVGPLLSVIFFPSLVWSIIKRQQKDLLIIFWLTIFYLHLATSIFSLVRWVTSLVPFFCLLVGRFITDLITKTKHSMVKFIVTFVFFIVSIHTLSYSVAYVKLMKSKATQDESSEWIQKNILGTASIGIPREPCVWDPAIIQMLYFYGKQELFYKTIPKYKVLILDSSIKELNSLKPDYVIFTDYEFDPEYRTKCRHYSFPDNPENLQKEKFFGEILVKYALLKRFEKKPELLGLKFVSGFFPYDWKFVCPTVMVYKRK